MTHNKEVEISDEDIGSPSNNFFEKHINENNISDETLSTLQRPKPQSASVVRKSNKKNKRFYNLDK
jgi:hypothetical protein